MNYAHYFERESYERTNEQRLLKHPLLQNDVPPELHVGIHAGHHKSKVDPLEQAICYSQMYSGMTNLSHCRAYHRPNMQLFEFENSNVVNDFKTWCWKKICHICTKMIKESYNVFVHLYQANRISLDTNKLEVIENFVKDNFQIKCSTITYFFFFF